MPITIRAPDDNHVVCSFTSVLSANLTDRLSGERTFDFSVLSERSNAIQNGMVVEHDGQYYNIVRVAKSLSGGMPVTSVNSEHISYLLNDEAYNLVTFVFEGTPLEGLTRLLEGTPFSVGIVEPTAIVACALTDGTLTRRNALIRFIDACGGEVEYDGMRINIRTHRGSTERKRLMDGENVTDLSVTLEAREGTASYSLSFFKATSVSAGDEVNITFKPMNICVDTRVIAVSYNPFYQYSVGVEVGSYVPNLMTSTEERLASIRQEFRAADGELLSRIASAEGSVSSLSQTATELQMKITETEADFAALSLTVFGFETTISNTLQIAEDAEDAALRAESLAGSAEASASQAATQVATVTSQISQLSDKISLVVTSSNAVNAASIVAAINGGTSSVKISASHVDLSGVTTTISADVAEIVADSLTLSASSSGTSSTIRLKSDGTTISSATISFSGLVKFTDLSTEGLTEIHGGNIKTGTLTADAIGANNDVYITFKHAIFLDSSYPNISGIQGLYFGPYGYILKTSYQDNTPLEIYGYMATRFTGAHPVYRTGNKNYPLLSTYNMRTYIDTTATFG